MRMMGLVKVGFFGLLFLGISDFFFTSMSGFSLCVQPVDAHLH